ncbi:hypothetical protein BASA81_005439 [Batrachochytrium salamandrivorans]|nr:hypothetical protein BASA81_005439 [Batrachochytrium salamandrivorans]
MESETEGNYYPVQGEEGDDSFELETKRALMSLFLWENPFFSLVWVVLLLLVGLLLLVYRYSLLTLSCYVVLIQLALTKLALILGPVVSKEFDPEEFVFQRQAFSPDQIFRFSRGLADLVVTLFFAWQDVLTTRDAKKFVDLERERIDSVRQVVADRMETSEFVQHRIIPVVQSLLVAFEPVIGRFQD